MRRTALYRAFNADGEMPYVGMTTLQVLRMEEAA